jgi:hypothetical protein
MFIFIDEEIREINLLVAGPLMDGAADSRMLTVAI